MQKLAIPAWYYQDWLMCVVIPRSVQGGVYNLVDKDGKVDPKRVLKAKHRYALLAKVRLRLYRL